MALRAICDRDKPLKVSLSCTICVQAMNLRQSGIFSQDDFEREKALLEKKRLGLAMGSDTTGVAGSRKSADDGKAASEGRS